MVQTTNVQSTLATTCTTWETITDITLPFFSPYGYFGQAVLSTNLIMSTVIILKVCEYK